MLEEKNGLLEFWSSYLSKRSQKYLGNLWMLISKIEWNLWYDVQWTNAVFDSSTFITMCFLNMWCGLHVCDHFWCFAFAFIVHFKLNVESCDTEIQGHLLKLKTVNLTLYLQLVTNSLVTNLQLVVRRERVEVKRTTAGGWEYLRNFWNYCKQFSLVAFKIL